MQFVKFGNLSLISFYNLLFSNWKSASNNSNETHLQRCTNYISKAAIRRLKSHSLYSLVFVKWFPVDDECCTPFSVLSSEYSVHDTSGEVRSCRGHKRDFLHEIKTVYLVLQTLCCHRFALDLLLICCYLHAKANQRHFTDLCWATSSVWSLLVVCQAGKRIERMKENYIFILLTHLCAH